MPIVTPSAKRRATHAGPGTAQTTPECNDQLRFTMADMVQDRIRQWQAQGVAALPPDAISVRSIPRSDAYSPLALSRAVTPVESEKQGASSEISEIARGRDSRRLADFESLSRARIGRASTPRKRVFSDDHWRGTKSKVEDLGDETPSKPNVMNHKQKSERAGKDSRQHAVEAKAEREERRRRRLDVRKRTQTKRPEDDKSDVGSVSERLVRMPSSHGEFIGDAESNVGHRSGHETDTERLSETPYTWDSDPDRDVDQVVKGSKYAATLGKRPQYGSNSLKPRKKMLSKTREMLGLNELTHEVSMRSTSIAAWLDEQPDASRDIGDHAPGGLTRSSRKNKQRTKPQRSAPRDTSLNTEVQDPNKIWDSVSVYHEPFPRSTVQHLAANKEFSQNVNGETSSTTLRRKDVKTSGQGKHTQHTLVQRSNEKLKTSQSQTEDRPTSPPRQSKDTIQHLFSQAKLPSTTTEIKSIPSPSIPLLPPPPPKDNKSSGENCSLKRRLTKHEDLMSELSRPGRAKSIHKSRSIRIRNMPSDSQAIQHVLSSMQEDEARYRRELRTLVDGVIPVLLQSVLSKNDSLAAATLFGSGASGSSDASYARPIIDMGIALERLKSLHNRFQLSNVDKVLSWCQTAHRAYSDYLKAWRLGFHDVIVNLAPHEGSEEIDDIMARDGNGDVVGADGEKVDVAYLLKRPLVRIRKLSKALSALQDRMKDHVVLAKISDDYEELTTQARVKHQQEQSRLEDEAAANIDATKTRDIRNLGPLPGVMIERKRKVRARDNFGLTFLHSSGQRMDCRIELIIRDDKDETVAGGDVLICQVDETGKWLLFAPIELGHISARRGESGYDLVIMVRGQPGTRAGWHELLALKTEEPDSATDCLNMLGSNPLPPKLNQAIDAVSVLSQDTSEQLVDKIGLTESVLAKVPSIETLDIPIGEPSVIGVQPPQAASPKLDKLIEKQTPKLSFGGGLQPKAIPRTWKWQSFVPPRKPVASTTGDSKKSSLPQTSNISGVTIGSDATSHATNASSAKNDKLPNGISLPPSQVYYPQVSKLAMPIPKGPSPNEIAERKMEPSFPSTSEPDTSHSQPETHTHRNATTALNADSHRITSPFSPTTPPSAFKHQGSSARKSFSSIPLTESIREKWAAMSARTKKPTGSKDLSAQLDIAVLDIETEIPSPPKHKTRWSMPAVENPLNDQNPPSPPEHRQSRKAENLGRDTLFEPELDCAAKSNNLNRASPLKHESAASTATESEEHYNSDYSSSSSSETSGDDESELQDDVMSLPIVTRRRPVSKPPVSRQSASPTTGTQTLAPSDSASQGPYRKVPSSSAYSEDRREWAKALVCAWSDTGNWLPVRDEECSIIISPGLIEAYPLSFLRAQGVLPEAPIVAFELTPIVPLRKGTALDITIRSPPTVNSRIKTTNNVMFRSRSPMECEKLYHMINWARCNNPTYIQLERARPQPQPGVTFSNQVAKKPKSWFSFGGPSRRPSYRAGSVPPSVADTTASSASGTNAFSALRRLSKSSTFSIKRSSVIRRPGRSTNQSLYSAETNTGSGSGSGSSFPAPPTHIGVIPGKNGPMVPETSAEAVNGAGMVNNMKIKLFVRQGQDWKPLGSCKLSVLPVASAASSPQVSRPGSSSGNTPDASVPNASVPGQAYRSSSVPGQPRREFRLPSSSNTPHRVHGDGREKRVLITQKDRPDVVLLDEVLGESCFEKVAERGIAVNVWTEDDNMRNRGGVMTGRGKIYMLQFGAQSEASWVFGLCGTYRYGALAGDI